MVSNGTKIAWVAESGVTAGEGDVWVASANGTSKTQLTSTGDVIPGYWTDHGVSWSPDGTRIAFAQGHGTDDQIWVMDANGANAHAIFVPAPSTMLVESPVWSPDGTKIAFTDTWGAGNGAPSGRSARTEREQ